MVNNLNKTSLFDYAFNVHNYDLCIVTITCQDFSIEQRKIHYSFQLVQRTYLKSLEA